MSLSSLLAGFILVVLTAGCAGKTVIVDRVGPCPVPDDSAQLYYDQLCSWDFASIDMSHLQWCIHQAVMLRHCEDHLN